MVRGRSDGWCVCTVMVYSAAFKDNFTVRNAAKKYASDGLTSHTKTGIGKKKRIRNPEFEIRIRKPKIRNPKFEIRIIENNSDLDFAN